MKGASRGRDLLCVAFLTLFVAHLSQDLIRGRAGLGPEAFLDGDVLFGAAPVKLRPFDDLTPIVTETPRDRWIVARVRSGHLDLWNPLQGAGVPLPPDQGGIFSPLRLCHVLFPGPGGYALFHVIRLWIAALGTFFLARARGTSRPGALLAGVVFGACGGMIAFLPFVSAGPVCFFPWVVLAQTMLLRRPSASRRVLLGLAVAATLTAGHPTIAVAMLLGAMACGLAGLAGARGARRRGLLDLAAGWLFGAAFAAPYLFSFVEYVENGFSYKHTAAGLREHGIWAWLTRGSLGPALAAPATLDALRETAGERAFPWLLHFVAGTSACVLAGAGVLRRRLRADLVVLLVMGVIFSFEPPPLALSKVPLLRDILPRYYWPFVVLPVACAAGAGVDALCRPAGWRWLAPALGLFALVMVAALAMPRIENTAALRDALPLTLGDLRSIPVRYHLAVIGALGLALLAGRFPRRRPDVAATALLLVTAVELVLLMRPHLREPRAEALRRPFPAAVRHLAEATAASHTRMTGTNADLALATLPSLAGIPDIRMTAPIVPARYEAFLRAAGAGEAFTLFTLPNARSVWADLAAVRFLVADARAVGLLASDPSVHVADTLPRGAVLETSTASGRARLFFGAAVATSRDDAVAQLRALAGRAKLRERVILEPAGSLAPAALAGTGSVDVRWILDDADEIILETEGVSRGYLMLADTHYPGWGATVDGASSPIFPADVGFRAVAVPPGKHTVRFVYRPRSTWSGIALLAAAAAVAGIAIHRERARG